MDLPVNEIGTIQNFVELCRICLQNKNIEGREGMAKIFETTIISLNVSLCDLFSLFTALHMEQIDGFPTQICTSCQDSLVASYEFQQKCIKSDHDIRMALGFPAQKTAIEDKFKTNCIFVAEVPFPDCLDNCKIKDELDVDGTVQDVPAPETSDDDGKPKISTFDLNELTSSDDSGNAEKQPSVKLKKRKKVYACLMCNKICDKPSSLLRHQTIHDPDGKPFECKYCKRRFAVERRMLCHQMTHLENKLQLIDIPVDKKHERKQQLATSGKNKLKSYSFGDDDTDSESCSQNKRLSDVKKDLVDFKNKKPNDDQKNISQLSDGSDSSSSSGSEYSARPRRSRAVLNQNQTLTCEICAKSFSKRYRLMRHTQIHNPEGKPYECKICKRRFAVEAHMIRHELNHSDELASSVEAKPKIFKCTECGREFLKHQALASHMNVHKHITKTKIFSCKYCEKTFPSLRKCTRHSKTHDELKIHRCHICDKAYAARGELSDHIKFKHEGIAPYVCPMCNKGFQHLYAHTIHLRTHSGETPYLCSDCGKGFCDNAGLKKHMRYHSKIKPFQCSECPSQFHTNAILKDHMLTHSGIKPYKCEYCGVAFSGRTSLTVHTRLHTGERPYKCNVCEKGFISSGLVTRHMRTHTGEKPYTCDFCGRTFAEKCDLNKHKRRLHAEFKAFHCEQCPAEFRLKTEYRKHNKEVHNIIQRLTVKRKRKSKKLMEPKLEPAECVNVDVMVTESMATTELTQ